MTGTCPNHVYDCNTFTDAPFTTNHHPLKFCSSVGGLELHVTNMARACVVRHEEGTIVRRPNGTFVGMRLPETLSADVRSPVGPPVSSKGWGQGTQRWLYT